MDVHSDDVRRHEEYALLDYVTNNQLNADQRRLVMSRRQHALIYAQGFLHGAGEPMTKATRDKAWDFMLTYWRYAYTQTAGYTDTDFEMPEAFTQWHETGKIRFVVRRKRYMRFPRNS